MKIDNLKFNIYRNDETCGAYGRIIRLVIYKIYEGMSSLKNNSLHKSFKHQHPVLGEILALHDLYDGSDKIETLCHKKLSHQQIDEWIQVLEDWFKVRKFRSQASKDYREAFLAVCEALRPYCSEYPRDFWIIPEEFIDGIPLIESKPQSDAEERERIKPQIIELEGGVFSLIFETEDGGHLWAKIIMEMALKDSCQFIGEINFDPESSMFSASSTNRSQIEYIGELIKRVLSDNELKEELVKKVNSK